MKKKLSFLEFINMLQNKMYILNITYSKVVKGVEKQIFELLDTIKWDI